MKARHDHPEVDWVGKESIIFYTDDSTMNESTGAGITSLGIDISIPMGRWTTVFGQYFMPF